MSVIPSKPSIIERIEEAKDRHAIAYGRDPVSLYLGTQEMHELRDSIAMPYSHYDGNRQVIHALGLNVYIVRVDSHLNVA